MSKQRDAAPAKAAPRALTHDAVAHAIGHGADAPSIAVEGATVTLTYASLADYNARTSADTEAVRALAVIKTAEATAEGSGLRVVLTT